MKPGGLLEAWMTSVPAGCCPGCRKPLPTRAHPSARLCGRSRCPGAKKYQLLYQQDRRGGAPLLRKVLRVVPVPGNEHRVKVFLDCAHDFEAPRSRARRGKRVRCPVCSEAARA